jgi:hypothetical protein
MRKTNWCRLVRLLTSDIIGNYAPDVSHRGNSNRATREIGGKQSAAAKEAPNTWQETRIEQARR